MAKQNLKLPPRPECGSIEINKMIEAINQGKKENPCPGSLIRDHWWRSLCKDKEDAVAYAKANGYPTEIPFAYVEPDDYEEALKSAMFESALPDNWMETVLNGQQREGE